MPPEPMAGLARIALARGDIAGAMATIAEVVAHFDGGGSVDGTEDPLWIYLTCYEVLAAAGSPRAGEFLTLPTGYSANALRRSATKSERFSPTYPPIARSPPLGRRHGRRRPDVSAEAARLACRDAWNRSR